MPRSSRRGETSSGGTRHEESSRQGAPGVGLHGVRKVYAFWGHHPAVYAASDYLTFLGRPGPIRGRAVRALGLSEGARVLEVGCGTGRNLVHLRRAVGGTGRIVAFDYSEEMLLAAERLARRKGWSNVTFLQGDAQTLDVGEETFDGVLSVLAVSAIPGWEGALRRCLEVLRPGGVLSVGDARLFSGLPGILNPIVEAAYRWGAAWDPSRDIPGRMREIFGNVRVERFNLGTFFIATSTRRSAGAWES